MARQETPQFREGMGMGKDTPEDTFSSSLESKGKGGEKRFQTCKNQLL